MKTRPVVYVYELLIVQDICDLCLKFVIYNYAVLNRLIVLMLCPQLILENL